MELEQIRNLISFTLMFNKQSGNRLNGSSIEYLLDKFRKFIGTDINKEQHKKSEELEYQLSLYLEKWKGIYNKDYKYTDEYFKFVNLFSYLHETQLRNDYDDVSPEQMIKNFNKYIGDSEKINNDMMYKGLLHPLLRDQFILPYIKHYERIIKILTIN